MAVSTDTSTPSDLESNTQTPFQHQNVVYINSDNQPNNNSNRIHRCVSHINYKYNVKQLLIFFHIIFIIVGIVTLLLWTVGFVPTTKFKENEQLTTCYLVSLNDVRKTCSTHYCSTYKSSGECKTWSYRYFDCYDVVGTFKYKTINNTTYTFTTGYYDTIYPINAMSNIRNHNNTKCYYNLENLSQVSFKEPNPLGFLIAGIIFASLTGICAIVIIILSIIYCIIRFFE